MPEYLQPVPRSDLFELLQYKIREVQDGTIEHLPKRFCVISYLHDMQSRKGTKCNADYARMWGWSKSWVSRHVDEIKREAERQASFYAQQRENAQQRESENAQQRPSNAAATSRNAAATKNGESCESGGGAATPQQPSATLLQRTSNTYISDPSDNKNHNGITNHHHTNPRRLQQSKIAEAPASEADGDGGVGKKMVRVLSDRGVAPTNAQWLAREFSLPSIQRQLHHLDWLKSKGQPPSSEAAWLVDAIRNRYQLPAPLRTGRAAKQLQPARQKRPAPRDPPPGGTPGKAPIDLAALSAEIDRNGAEKRQTKGRRRNSRPKGWEVPEEIRREAADSEATDASP